MAFNPSTSLSVTLSHAISYLTRPLIVQYSATTIIKLQLILEANLTALYAPTWVPKEPLRGSGRRCLTLSPDCLPSRAIYSACLTAGVQWFDWIALLGGREFDFFVDPGCISVRHGRKGSPDCKLITVWADEVPSPSLTLATKVQSRTIAQQLMENETDEEEQIFAMIAQETKSSVWGAPSLDKLTIPATLNRSSSPFSTASSISVSSSHSRSSSRSSNSSSGFSYSSESSSNTTISSSAPSPSKQSRRERARQARVFIDTSKTEVTPYDGGKTTVLTGGVMLGGNPSQGRATISPKRQITFHLPPPSGVQSAFKWSYPKNAHNDSFSSMDNQMMIPRNLNPGVGVSSYPPPFFQRSSRFFNDRNVSIVTTYHHFWL